jgi:molecular chaperone HscB
MRFYESLGLEPALALDPEDLKQRFYAQSRLWHPDRFSRAGEAERQQALDKTAVLNDAFRTLRDPVSRAEYFLRERGIDVSRDAPPELLEEVFELNMALEEMRGGGESARPQLEPAAQRFQTMLAELDARLETLFARHDRDPGPAVLQEIGAALNRRRYIANLVREVEGRAGLLACRRPSGRRGR